MSADITKWKRLFNTCIEQQNLRQFGNHVLMFINRAMNPVTYTEHARRVRLPQAQLNSVLAFSGMSVGGDGKVRRAAKRSISPT